MDIFINILQGGWQGLISYLSAHVITCLVPALFIAGAIATFVSQAAILKYFGPQANKTASYSIAFCLRSNIGRLLLYGASAFCRYL